MLSADWASVVVDAVAAVGTLGAFAVGFVLFRREHHREESRAEDQRRSQAVKVSAWVEAQRTAQGGREVLFFVHNASDMPIYEVSLLTPAWIFRWGDGCGPELQACNFDHGLSVPWVGSWSDCRVGAPGSTLRRGSFHDRRGGWGGGQVGAGIVLIACQVLITSVVQGQSARRCSHRLRCPRVSRAGSCHSR